MLSLWNWGSSICRQKRILLLLCTFGSSFIAFNYSLLSSTAVIQSQNVFSNERHHQKHEQQLQQSRASLLLAPYRPLTSPAYLKKTGFVRGADATNKVSSYKSQRSKASISQTSQAIAISNFNASEVLTSGSAHKSPSIASNQNKIYRQFNTGSNTIGYANENNNNSKFGRSYRNWNRSSNDIYANGKTEVDQLVASSVESSITLSNNNNTGDSITDYSISYNSIFPFLPPTLSPPLPTYPTSPLYNSDGNGNNNGESNNNTMFLYPPTNNLFRIPPCNTRVQLRRVQKRKKNLTVIENFIMGRTHVECNESVTYTTHGDYRYLDNLVPLVERWNGPVSLAIYAPGSDLEESLKLISYFKMCTSSKIDKWVTFHLIYDVKYTKRPTGNYTKPWDIPWLDALYENGKWTDCSKQPNFTKGDSTFRMQNRLLYPINIARNIARSAATTHFVLASDIELFPSINLIPSFMEMLHRLQKEEEERINYAKNKFTLSAAAVAKIIFPTHKDSLSNTGFLDEKQGLQQPGLSPDHRHRNRHVFVLPVFEVKKEITPSQVETKKQLAVLLKNKTAVIFHHSICPQCHTFPKFEEWKVALHDRDGAANEGEGDKNNSSGQTSMRIFYKAKRKFPFQLWEPIFIGTKEEPIYDERLSWEGLRDKMVLGYIMCVLDYDFYILDNAFLVHKPGIRRLGHLVTKTVLSQDRLINYRIRTELLKRYGKHDECAL